MTELKIRYCKLLLLVFTFKYLKGIIVADDLTLFNEFRNVMGKLGNEIVKLMNKRKKKVGENKDLGNNVWRQIWNT